MRIAIVCDVLGKENNGTTIAAMNLIRYLKSRGHDVRIVCPDADKKGQDGYYVVPTLNVGPLNGYVKKNGVTIAWPNKQVLEKAIGGADVVHVMTPFPLAIAAVRCAKGHGVPVTAGFHCQAENVTNHLFLMNSRSINTLAYRLMYRYVYRYVDRIHYPTEFIRGVFESVVGPTNGCVISNGVNSRFVHRQAEKPEELKNKFVILFTGRYGKEKSHRVLIDAVSRLPFESRVQLIFAGDGPLKEKLRKYGRRKLTNPPIQRFFARDELVNILNFADLYVHPAEIEIEAIACLEAISCGLVPVIADSPRSATRFFALDEKNLFRVNDADDLAKKIAYWHDHPEDKLSRSREYLGYAQRFAQENCMQQMEQMLASAALGSRGGGD